MRNKSLGENIRRLRKEKKLTLTDVSSSIGISHSYLSRIERNLQKPSLDVIENLSAHLNVPKSDLFPNDIQNLDTPKSRLLNDLIELNITEEELQMVIKYLKELRELKERHLKN
ncbi:helix-turn-helix transcriptional regulator [Bacillus subtilis]